MRLDAAEGGKATTRSEGLTSQIGAGRGSSTAAKRFGLAAVSYCIRMLAECCIWPTVDSVEPSERFALSRGAPALTPRRRLQRVVSQLSEPSYRLRGRHSLSRMSRTVCVPIELL